MKTIATKVAKQSSVKRVINFTKKLKLKTTKTNKINAVQRPIQSRNSRKSRLYSLLMEYNIEFLIL